MGKFKDLTGQRFDRLIVISLYTKRPARHHKWLCLCDCGNTKAILGHDLVGGLTKSCGCLAKERASEANSLPDGEASLNALYYSYKRSAKQRGYSFELTKEQFKELTSKNCYYDGSPPTQDSFGKKFKCNFVYNGIDRIDNTKGYIMENCVPCCGTCNRAKEKMTFNDFMGWINNLVKYNTGR